MTSLQWIYTTPYELAERKQSTVQFNYYISLDGMLYSIPYEYSKRKVDVRVTDFPLADAILDRIMHDTYKINIESIDPSKDISMREVYCLDKTISE